MMEDTMKRQTIENQKGEIEFRRKLIRQQIDEEQVFNDEFNSDEIKDILKSRMKSMHDDLVKLKDINDINISPYLEIGAERCQSSLVLENDFSAEGCAVDISFDMLKTCKDYGKAFRKDNIPLRVCCDAYNLPFAKDSIPFIFCYHTLHHFPDPKPIIQKIYDVLRPGGCFFIGTEPYKKILHANLYKSDKIHSKNALKAGYIRKVFDYFFSYQPCNEIEHGIIENEGISLDQWKGYLGLFHKKHIKTLSFRHIKTDLYDKKGLKFIIAYLLGGSISGACYKYGKKYGKTGAALKIENTLVCPECKMKNLEMGLMKAGDKFKCKKCGRDYPVIDGIPFLFIKSRFKSLYPEFYKSSAGNKNVSDEAITNNKMRT